MKALILSASPNKTGLTNSCVDICKQTLKDNKIEVEWICLNHYQIQKCEACGPRGWGMCLENHRCRMQDDFNQLQERIQEYDCYIMITPV